MEVKDYSRRKFINKCCSTGSLFLVGALFLTCRDKSEEASKENRNEKQSTSENPCNDLANMSNGEIKKRESLGYVTKSLVPDNSCGNCGLYIPPKPNEKCGGCLLFKGPVEFEGHCVQWAAATT